MIKVLFLIHDLGHGGAEKVLVNLVNNMDYQKFDITVMTMFGGGVNEQFLKPHIHYQSWFKKPFPGNSKVMKLLTPKQLHTLFIKEQYDIEVAYLEGPAVRVISGCPDETTLLSWVHCTMHSEKEISVSFRSFDEAKKSYCAFDGSVFVSQEVKKAFEQYCPDINGMVLYNTNDSNTILKSAKEPLKDYVFKDEEINLIAVGKIEEVKGFDRLAKIHTRLRKDGYQVHTYILGEGGQKAEIQSYLEREQMQDSFTFLGYQTNPYQYVKNCDLFVCSSHSEGFSTAATEALIVGTPVCTVDVSGMKEMFGENNEWGLVTENSEEALFQGIKFLLDDANMLAHYKKQAEIRGKIFSTENTVKAVEEMMMEIMEK